MWTAIVSPRYCKIEVRPWRQRGLVDLGALWKVICRRGRDWEESFVLQHGQLQRWLISANNWWVVCGPQLCLPDIVRLKFGRGGKEVLSTVSQPEYGRAADEDILEWPRSISVSQPAQLYAQMTPPVLNTNNNWWVVCGPQLCLPDIVRLKFGRGGKEVL
jgi:hypothetical protein